MLINKKIWLIFLAILFLLISVLYITTYDYRREKAINEVVYHMQTKKELHVEAGDYMLFKKDGFRMEKTLFGWKYYIERRNVCVEGGTCPDVCAPPRQYSVNELTYSVKATTLEEC